MTPDLQVTKDDAVYETEDAILYFNGPFSLFQQKLNFIVNKVVKGPGGLEVSKANRSTDPSKLDKIGALYYKDLNTNELLYRENFTFSRERYNNVKDTLAHIDWSVSNEKKSIGKFVCFKAEADIYGRHWIAWFSTEIPVSIGPWKLGGLPGAILEAYDSTNYYQFLFREISAPDLEAESKITELKPHTLTNSLTKTAYIALYKQKKEERRKYIMSILEEGNGSGRVEFKEEIEPFK